jgi:predicted permease
MKLYRFLLKLYPARFREEYGRPLEQQFLDEYREADGTLARFAFWARTVRDLAISIPLELLRELRQDLRYSVRTYSRRPVVTLMAVAALALAIGATTGVFSVVNALLLRSLPFRSPERIVQLGLAFRPADTASAFEAWRNKSKFLEDAAVYTQADMNLGGSAESQRVKVTETSSSFFRTLGSEPVIGRAFVDGEGGVAVISYTLLQQFFGGDPRAIGSIIHLNSTPLTVIGIARPGLDYPAKTAVWTPTVFDISRLPKSTMFFWVTFGHVKSGLTLKQAQSMFDAEQKRDSLATTNSLIPLRTQLAGPVERASLVLLGAVVFVLLIACANVANLLLTRISERRKELVLRAALGASRARLIQQLITESILLTCVAAFAGLIVANWAAKLASSAQPAQLAVQNYTILDWHVLAFATGLAMFTGFLFGFLPASLIGRLQPTEDLVRSQPGSSTSRVRRLRSVLVAVQICLTLILLGGSIVMGRSFLKMLGTDLGFRTDHVVTMSVSLAGTGHEKSAMEYYRAALDRLRAIPAVESAGAIEALPLAVTGFSGSNFRMESGRLVPYAAVIPVTPDYFQTMATPIVHGRALTAVDQKNSELVGVVNQEFLRVAGEDASFVNRRLTFPQGKRAVLIVGIVHDVRYSGPAQGVFPQLFLPAEQRTPLFMTFVARVRGRPEAYLPICRDAIQSLDRQVPVFGAKTLDDRLSEALARPRFYTVVVLFFGGFALLLAVIGVYGVATYSIVQRTHELGVRIAVGASAQHLRCMLLRQSLMPVAIGMTAGVAGAFALGRFLEHLMNTAQRMDAVTSAEAAILLVSVAGVAIWSASQRILRLDAMQILRAE